MSTTSLQTITPMLASRWLEKVPDFQRKQDKNQIKKLVLAIQRKEWRQNGATIVFNENDELIDGQHRLKAVVESGIPIDSLVVRGVSKGEDTFQTIGDEKPRKLADFMHVPCVNIVASVMRMYWLLTTGVWPVGSGGQPAPIADVMKLAKKWTQDVSVLVEPLRPAGRFLGQHSFCVFLVLYHTKLRPIENGEQERLSEFFARVGDGLNLAASCPVYKLRQRFLAIPNTGKLDRTSAQALITKAMYLYLDGKACGQLRYEPNRESFPELRGFRK